MTKTPRKIGVVVSGGNTWEIVFSFLHIERLGFLRVPITIPINEPGQASSQIEAELAHNQSLMLADVKATSLDTIIIPGGTRLFNYLCNYEQAGSSFRVDECLKTLLKGIYRLNKPIGAFGPASVIVAKALQGITRAGLVATVGSDPKLQAAIASTGAQAVVTRPGEVVLDETNKLVTSGGEVGSKRPTEVFEACENLVSGLSELINQ